MQILLVKSWVPRPSVVRNLRSALQQSAHPKRKNRNVTRTRAEIVAAVHPAETDVEDPPTQVETDAVVHLVDTEAADLPEAEAEVAAEAAITAVVTEALQAAENAVAMEAQAAPVAPVAATEEVSAAEAADHQPQEGTLVTASTEEIKSLFFRFDSSYLFHSCKDTFIISKHLSIKSFQGQPLKKLAGLIHEAGSLREGQEY